MYFVVYQKNLAQVEFWIISAPQKYPRFNVIMSVQVLAVVTKQASTS